MDITSEMCPECVRKNPKQSYEDVFNAHYKRITLCKYCKSRIADYRFFSDQMIEQLEDQESCHMYYHPQFKTVEDISCELSMTL